MKYKPLIPDGTPRERGRQLHRNLWISAAAAVLVPLYSALRGRRSPRAEG